MNVVAFDTSTVACSVAVNMGDEVLSDHRLVQREHATLLLPMVSELLSQFGVAPHQLDGVVFGRGPGSFTGVRIAAAAAQGLALAADCGVHGVSSLQAMACGCVRESEDCESVGYVTVAIDARMDQVYANTYRAVAAVTPMGEEVVVYPSEYPWPNEVRYSNKARYLNDVGNGESAAVKRLVLCGSGAARYESDLLKSLEASDAVDIVVQTGVYPRATDLLLLTDGANSAGDRVLWKPAADAQPVYLRNKVALTEAERAST